MLRNLYFGLGALKWRKCRHVEGEKSSRTHHSMWIYKRRNIIATSIMQQVHSIGTDVTEHCTLTRTELRHIGYLKDGATPTVYYSKLQHLKHNLMFFTPSFRAILFLHSHFPPFFITFFFFLSSFSSSSISLIYFLLTCSTVQRCSLRSSTLPPNLNFNDKFTWCDVILYTYSSPSFKLYQSSLI